MGLRFGGRCSLTKLMQQNNLRKASYASKRFLSHYPVNDNIYGLNEEKRKLRETAFNFFQKELAPFAKEIDKNDHFP